MKTRLSDKFIQSIKLSDRRQYKIAFDANINPNILSQFMSGVRFPKKNDPRVIAVGLVVGIPADECFEREENDAD